VSPAVAGLAGFADAVAVIQEAPQHVEVLVVDDMGARVDAEDTLLAAAPAAPSSPAGPTGAAVSISVSVT
jgi:hypothetical protein